MDKNMLQGLDGLPEEDQRRMAAVIDQLQVRDRFVNLSFNLISFFHFFILNRSTNWFVSKLIFFFW